MVCEGVRQEMGNKLTILGFYGMAPNVDVFIYNPTIHSTLALVAGFPPVADLGPAYDHSFVVNKPDDTVLLRTPPSRLNIAPGTRGLVVCGLMIPPPYTFGQYTVRILVNGESKLNTSFHLRQIGQAEFNQAILPPGPGGRPN